MKREHYFLIFWIMLLVVIAFGCATSPFHETPREEKCLALCQADLEHCGERCEDSGGFEAETALCKDQCEKTFYSCNEKCPK